jgi:Xaa-Pro dipeptidase
MASYRDAAAHLKTVPETVYLEKEVVPIALLERFRKYFPVTNMRSADTEIAKTRSVKSAYEIQRMERAGAIHRSVLEEGIPEMLREGMTEAEFGAGVYLLMVSKGHHGIVRFGMFQTEIEVGQLGFGDSSIYPAAFDGPGGCRGIGPAAPVLGSQSRTLRKGDLVFIDNACGFEGYQTDKTMTYMFRKSLPEEAVAAHRQCVEIQGRMAAMLQPGISPSQIYTAIYESLPPGFQENFMGFGNRRDGPPGGRTPGDHEGIRRTPRGGHGPCPRTQKGDQRYRDGWHREYLRGDSPGRQEHHRAPPGAHAC